MKKDRPF